MKRRRLCRAIALALLWYALNCAVDAPSTTSPETSINHDHQLRNAPDRYPRP